MQKGFLCCPLLKSDRWQSAKTGSFNLESDMESLRAGDREMVAKRKQNTSFLAQEYRVLLI